MNRTKGTQETATEMTEADRKLTELGWDDLIAREFHVVLPDQLRQVLWQACQMWDCSPAGGIALALRSGLHDLAGDESAQDADPYVAEMFQDRDKGVYPPRWADWLWKKLRGWVS